MLRNLKEWQEDMRVMHLHHKESIEESARRLNAHYVTLRVMEEQMHHFKSNITQKQQEVLLEDGEINKKDKKPCSVVTLRSGKQLGAQKIRI